MVFNYRSLNDNTYKDQYSLPGINTIIQKVKNAKVFLKFDLKSGFHQVAMEEESIPWTAFLAPGGLYECESSQYMNSLSWSSHCVEGKYPPANHRHIIKKIAEIDEESMETKKGLRSFLGILNYARQHIPKLGILLRPLYEKTNAHGDKRLKPSDYQLIREIKRKVQQLPDLSIPPEEAHIILEVDGCMEGWGGIVKWKQKKNDPRSTEKVYVYASGKFTNVQSTIDAEISACINTLEKLKIYYLDKQEITLRTDCQAIISFYKKTSSSKASRVRWMKFADAITGTGVKIEIEHIEGKYNVLADSLSSSGRRQSFSNERCLGERRQLAWYLTDEGASDIQANIPDLQPLPTSITRTIQTQEPAGEYKRIQREAHTYPINVDTACTLKRIAGTMEAAAIKNAVSALTEVYEIMRYKAQICCGKRSRDNYFEDVWPDISAQTLKGKRRTHLALVPVTNIE
ncbi:Orf y [Tanacetum coccineum]